MSLVAYGASDESETSDVDDAEVLPKPNNVVGKTDEDDDNASYDDGKISDEEDYVPTAISQDALSSSSEMNNPFHSAPAPTTLSDLPAPKAAVLTASQGESEGEVEDELEEEVKPKPAQIVDAPTPPPKKAKQPKKIVIPALKQDSDKEEEENKKRSKQQAPAGSGSRSGLFALLPPPVHSAKKETNRPLIPYTLTKRPTQSKTSQPANKGSAPSSTTPTISGEAEADLLPSQKHQSAFNALTGYESDSDEEESGPRAASGDLNFFSLGSKAGGSSTSSEVSTVKDSTSEGGESKPRILNGGESSETAAVQSSSPPSSSQPRQTHASYSFTESPVSSSTSMLLSTKEDSAPDGTAQSSAFVNSNDDDSNKSSGENEVSSTVGVPLFNQDAPLNFNSSIQGRGWSAAPLTSPMLPEMYAATSSSSGTNYWQQHEHYAQDYSAEVEQDNSDNAPVSSGGSNIQEYMEDEQFLRISGKRKHKQEDIQIIDANVDDYVDPSDLMKGITEESSYQPHRKKDNMPSMQQKRKKQITYLAFQAKERELELKNAWSQSRMTKNQARSKYGF